MNENHDIVQGFYDSKQHSAFFFAKKMFAFISWVHTSQICSKTFYYSLINENHDIVQGFYDNKQHSAFFLFLISDSLCFLIILQACTF